MIAATSQEINLPVKQLPAKTKCDYCGKWVKHIKAHLQIHRKTQVACDTCGKSFTSKSGYRRHQLSYCDIFKCPHCKRSFPEIVAYKTHIAEHTSDLNRECPFCNKPFGTTRYLKLHMKEVHRCTVIFRCLKCNYCSADFREYESHVAIHACNEKLYTCNHCEFVSEKRSDCSVHINAAHAVRETCNVCKEDFTNIFDLQDHNLKMHDLKCKHCGLTCKTMESFKNHLKHHRSSKPNNKLLVCPICNKDFSHMKKLYRRHLHEHKLSNAAFKCEYCSRVFTREKAREYHIDHMHKSSDGFLCLICNYSTQSSDDYKTHISSHNV